MKNALEFFYNMTAKEIHRKNDKYSFNINNEKYLLCQYNRTFEELQEIYNLSIYLQTIGVYCHKIILNNKREILTIINNIPYVLVNIRIENRIIDLKDIINLSNIFINNTRFSKIKRDNWSNLWSEKIDFLEYEIRQLGNKYPFINDSIDYHIGIVENCIQMLNNENNKQRVINTISHRRLNKNMTTEEFYNPLNFIIDNRVRDICEYIKSFMGKDINIITYIDQYIYNSKLNNDEIEKLFIRIMYPSMYFDAVEKILETGKQEELSGIEPYIIEKNEENIKRIYNYLNTISPLPDIEWIKKKMLYNINNTFDFRDFIH